ncbi:MAG: NIPSNAP family containing protein [Bacteroidetes bacterium GWF2_42_66]|nr:MAG: NIPSNAP family containing protein [Bacteroidetes bacterium GWA2_42_15]OFY00737.1 MAG: NIPSNAP family containing protein [Bacteroidetes bacterium GWE2_42_39]OFY40762.1 MAG: NIPSNAP family containing protein [Bacteroidetes bacterium GWF2_42_66]HBL75774.1 NIPSNAP family containing protein [Prolixibacteraceae bacterium]HCR89586.1 NIPSNAP family containing protein [Prolixibacteraceae bacterium]
MKLRIRPSASVLFFIVLIVLSFLFGESSTAARRDYYALKVYHMKDQSQSDRVEKYLKEAYIPALHKAGIQKVGVFKPIEEKAETGLLLFVWLPLKSLEQFSDLNATIEKDAQYQAAGTDYIEAAHNNTPFQRIETILLKAFENMPAFSVPNHSTPPSERVYELRSYEGPTEKMYQKKVEMFNAGGEIALFKKLEFNALFYAEVISGSAMPNLMYMTTFSDMKSHDEHWDTFRNHPDWKVLSGMEKYKNTVSNSTKYLLRPTDYSDL